MKITTLEKIYPYYTIVGLEEMIVDGSGWYSTLITDTEDIFAIAQKGHDAAGRKIRLMALKLRSPDGHLRTADFRPEEIV